MLFQEQDAPLLKAWIVKRLANTSDADADVLADYVIALLRHDGDLASVRKLCATEIPDFLTEEPRGFLDDVFQAVAYKSYLPGAPPAPPVSSEDANGSPPQPDASNGMNAVPAKKRTFNDRDDDGPGEQDMAQGGSRTFKQARRGGRRGGRMEGFGDRHQDGYPSMGALPMAPGGMPSFDPNNPMEAFMQMQAMGMQYPGFPSFAGQGFRGGGGSGGRKQSRRKGRCRDFDTKGFCSRGSTCMYDHGNESVYVPPMQNDEYNPNDAAMSLSSPSKPMNPFEMFMPMPEMNRSRGGRGGRKGRAGRKGNTRASFSADGPVHDRTKSTIVVENIPEESFTEEQVRDFFGQHGSIVEVSMQPYKHLAVVKYDKWGSANAAYRSPKVIFDNRFVKVFWYKDDAEAKQAPSDGVNGFKFNGSAGQEIVEPELEPEMDPEEFQRRQEEAQKQYQEREAKRTEIEQKRLHLEKQQQDLLDKHRQESERLQARLTGKNGSDSGGGGSGSTGTDMLRAQVAMLEQEAKILGIDPNADAAADDDEGSQAGGFRGGFRGRGRGRGGRGEARGGGYRGRGFAPRGRGVLRGGVGGGRHAAYAQYSLDNRPRKVAITGVDFTAAEKDEQLRHFLLNLGDFESVDTSPYVTSVSFQDRKTAERFFHTLQGKELPNVQGKLELSWASNGPLPPVAGPSSSSAAMSASGPSGGSTGAMAKKTAGGGGGSGEDDDTGDAMAGMEDGHDEAGAEQGRQQEGRQVDMDYEDAGEDAW